MYLGAGPNDRLRSHLRQHNHTVYKKAKIESNELTFKGTHDSNYAFEQLDESNEMSSSRQSNEGYDDLDYEIIANNSVQDYNSRLKVPG